MKEFVHLHNHSQFSLLDGASPLEDLLDRCVELGMDSMAVTDHGNLFGAVRFFDMAVAKGVRPILGMEGYMAPADRHDRTARAIGTQGAQKKPYYHQILLATNATGYSNLIKLSSVAYTEGFYYKPRIDKQLLAEHAAGLIATSACLGGEVAQLPDGGRHAGSGAGRGRLAEIMGREQLLPGGAGPGAPRGEEGQRGADFTSRAPRAAAGGNQRLPLPDARRPFRPRRAALHPDRQDREGRRERMRYTGSTTSSPPRRCGRSSPTCPRRSRTPSRSPKRCHFTLENSDYHLPHFPVPQGEDEESYFGKVVAGGVRGAGWSRCAIWRRAAMLSHPIEAYRKRLESEMRHDRDDEVPGYFLIVWDFIRYARENGIPVGPGRGSAAGSLWSPTASASPTSIRCSTA